MGRGRGGKSRTQRKHFRDNRENVWKRSKSDLDSTNSGNNENSNSDEFRGWQPFATQNPAFDEYYKGQGIVAPAEWDSFMEVLRKPLPAAFRINSSSQFCDDIRSQLENDFMESLKAEIVDGYEKEAIRPLPWYPENLAWHSNFSRMQLRKNQTLERFHEFLKLENEIGNITRQEAVSMVPPLFLDVRPDHFVLDMCAAPGSKTFQLLEMMHQSIEPGSLPNGMVVANDLDVQRCNLLIHQTKRMSTANLIVTNHEAQQFPGWRSKRSFTNGFGMESKLESTCNQLLFDRVLCDVPCSGDGTLRKAPDIWRKWNIGMGNGIHGLQVQIAMRGMALLKVGGRMVYSTCSMNPVENEAVVAEILRKCGQSVELLDVSGELPQLVRRPGLKKWKVRDKGAWLASHKDVSKYRRNGITPSMFPSGRSYIDTTENGNIIEVENQDNGASVNIEDGLQPTEDPAPQTDNLDEDVSDLPLERCMRILPHDQNTGAFFIAVFHKHSPLPAIQEKSLPTKKDESLEKSPDKTIEGNSSLDIDLAGGEDEKISEACTDTDLIDNKLDGAEESCKGEQVPGDKEKDSGRAGSKRKLQIQGKWRGVDPVVFFNDEATINSIKTFYGLDESFPFAGHLVTRNTDTNHVKRIYYVSKSVKDALQLNFQVGQQLKITSIGMKIFERQTSREGTATSCAFRISSEGLPIILPYISKQVLYASAVDFKHLLQYKTIKFADFVDADFGDKASKLMMGCCVIVLSKGNKLASDHIQVDGSKIAIGCWKGRGSLSVMVTATDCQELLERLKARMEIEKDSVPVPESRPTDEADEVQGTDGSKMEIFL